MKPEDKVKINVPDEKWCHGFKGVIETPSSAGLWMVRVEGLPPGTDANNPFEFDEKEIAVYLTEQEFLAVRLEEQNTVVAEKVMGWRVKWTERTHRGHRLGSYQAWVKDDRSPRSWFKCPAFVWDHGWAVKAFTHVCDPNRTSIHPCGNGQDGLWWAVYYDDQMIARHTDFAMALCIYALKVRGAII